MHTCLPEEKCTNGVGVGRKRKCAHWWLSLHKQWQLSIAKMLAEIHVAATYMHPHPTSRMQGTVGARVIVILY